MRKMAACTKEQIEECRALGMTYAKIGEKYGISRQRVEQILHERYKKRKCCKIINDNPNTLYNLRITKGMTQYEVATWMEKSISWVSRIENGRFKYIREDIYKKLLKLYNVETIDGVNIKRKKTSVGSYSLNKEFVKLVKDTAKKINNRRFLSGWCISENQFPECEYKDVVKMINKAIKIYESTR